MLLNSLYFSLRNFIPLSVRRGIRRRFVLRKREQVGDVWPIMPGSERPAEGWPGWPAGRQFALVLTHDVERQIGLDRVKEVAELEMRLGLRRKTLMLRQTIRNKDSAHLTIQALDACPTVSPVRI